MDGLRIEMENKEVLEKRDLHIAIEFCFVYFTS